MKWSDNVAKLQIFRMDEYSWYVAHNLMEFLNWYHKNIDNIESEDDLSCLEVIEPEDGCMWCDTCVTQADIDELGEYDILCRGEVGDLKRVHGKIFKRVTFADVLGDGDIKEPYEIASTEI